jgi:hypothetical protein
MFGPLVEFFGDKIIIDFGLGRDARLSFIIAGKEWIWPSPFILFRTKWIGGNLFGINMLFHDFCFFLWIAIYETLSTQDKLSGAMVLFRLSDAIYVEVIGKMLITYSLSAHSPIAFGLIYTLDVSFPFVVALALAPSLGSLI